MSWVRQSVGEPSNRGVKIHMGRLAHAPAVHGVKNGRKSRRLATDGTVVTGVGTGDGGFDRTEVDDARQSAETQGLLVRGQRVVERQPVVARLPFGKLPQGRTVFADRASHDRGGVRRRASRQSVGGSYRRRPCPAASTLRGR